MAVSVETRSWTVDDLYRIPDDENRYEVLDGELLVTPPAGPDHEAIISRLHALLVGYVATNRLGIVSSRNSAVHRRGSLLIPDLLVRRPPTAKGQSWADQALPILVVEVRSPSTWNRDSTIKRAFYLDQNIPDYWMVHPDLEEVVVARHGEPDRLETGTISWHPARVAEPLEIALRQVFHGD